MNMFLDVSRLSPVTSSSDLILVSNILHASFKVFFARVLRLVKPVNDDRCYIAKAQYITAHKCAVVVKLNLTVSCYEIIIP